MKSALDEATKNMHEAVNNTLRDEHLFEKKVRTTEGSAGTHISPAAPIASEDRAKLTQVYKELYNSLGQEYEVVLNNDRIIVKLAKHSDSAGYSFTPFMGSILEHMVDLGMKIQPLPEIKIRRDMVESADFFGKTAYYDPVKKEVVLYVEGRHPKDVMRSFTHEMIHHMQNMEDRLGNVNTSNVNEDESLQEIEKEAYLKGNMTFRTWEDKVKNSNG